ncbi:MAG TPA: hypothetical protein VFU46_13790 [Gemmatimonadales bacterium]|nr:hypothetical protein [Gemmatimonadales bacterium]
MVLTYTIDPTAGIVWLRYGGVPDLPTWIRTMEAVFADPGYQPGLGFVIDRRGVEAPSVEYLRGAIAFMRAHGPEILNSRWAVVADNPAMYGMGRMGQALGAELPIVVEIFPDVDAAERWLRRQAPPRGGQHIRSPTPQHLSSA